MFPAIMEILDLASETGALSGVERLALKGVGKVAGKKAMRRVGKMLGRDRVANEPKVTRQ